MAFGCPNMLHLTALLLLAGISFAIHQFMHDWPIFLFNMPDFTQFIEKWGYIGIFIWFITFDQITPIPEEISLLLVGYLSAHNIFNPFLAGAVAFIGMVCVDVLYYHLSKTGSRIIKKRSKKKPSKFVETYKEKLRQHTPRTLIILCFIPRMRMWGPILAGSIRISFKKFMIFDGIGLLLITIIYTALGYYFHKSLGTLMQKLKGWEEYIFIGALIILAFIIIIVIRKKIKEKKASEAA
jgi:membrane protein DedA with SNARE-associated domain